MHVSRKCAAVSGQDMHKYKNLKQIACIRFHAICFGPAAETSVCSCALPWPTYIRDIVNVKKGRWSNV